MNWIWSEHHSMGFGCPYSKGHGLENEMVPTLLLGFVKVINDCVVELVEFGIKLKPCFIQYIKT